MCIRDSFITDVPVIPLWGEKKVIGAQGSLEGLKLSPIGSHEYQNATVTSRKDVYKRQDLSAGREAEGDR